MKLFIKLVAIIAVFYINAAFCQPKSVTGVYAGIQIMPGVVMGGGMSRSDEVLLLRPNGTYSDDLSKTDWQTRVTGRYTVSGRQLILRNSNDNKASTYKFDNDGNIDMGSYSLVKQPVDNSVPKGKFEFSMMNSSGGGSSGMVYVGTGSDKNLYFDGKGNFTSNSSSATAVIGSNVGGGSSKKSAGDGTYSINKGLLTLKFRDGRTEKHSFFCRPGYEPVMAVIDGNVYFMDDDKKSKSSANAVSKKSPREPSEETPSASSQTPNLSDGKALLQKANTVHGGKALDDIRTVSFSATMQGLQLSSYLDVINNRVRIEVRQSGKLMQVEQAEGEAGWQWRSGQITDLASDRLSEMRSAFYSGILGLRQSQIANANIKEVKKVAKGYTIVCAQNGKDYAFFLDDDGRMIASADQSGKAATTSAYANFRSVSGVLIPFTELLSSGGQKTSIQYKNFVINPSLSDETWKKP